VGPCGIVAAARAQSQPSQGAVNRSLQDRASLQRRGHCAVVAKNTRADRGAQTLLNTNSGELLVENEAELKVGGFNGLPNQGV